MSIMPIPVNRIRARSYFARPAMLLVAIWRRLGTWHDRRRATAHLQSMSDRELRDLGVTRPEIERLVRGAANCPRRDAA